MKFVHLHNHTHYSLLDGLTKIDEFVKQAKEDGSEAIAITDHGVMYGVIDFYQRCLKEGIKPIIGVETYLAPGSRHDKNTRSDERNYHLLLLAKNNEGYQNLLKLITIAHLEGFYYKPRIDWEVLKKYHKGLIACTACLAGEIPKLIMSDKLKKAKERILEYNNLFGQDNFYLEIQHHPELPEQAPVNDQLIKFSRELNIPLVATNDIHYLRKDDAEAQDILLCLQNKKKLEDVDRMSMAGVDYSMKRPSEMIEAFKHVPDAIENTLKIAEKCNIQIKLGEIHLPHFEVPEGHDGNSYLRKLCLDGFKKRYGQSYQEVNHVIKDRMDYELSVIKNMGWPSYFLIVADFVNWAKSKNIVVGPGRGSAAGSLVSYLIGITNLDPIKYELLFERFLNPERISMPDIDLDFADIRRDEVIRYVEKKYGKDHVSQIITFGTMAARAAIRDVGRVLDAPYEFCDKLAKMVPMFSNLEDALKSAPDLKDIYRNDPLAKKIIDFSKRLEGVARHSSTHACGVLITKEPLDEYTPVQYASSSDKSIVSQYSLHPVEDLGLLKMDFLGLKNLTIIESAIKIIKKTRNVSINIDEIPLDDKKTYELFQKGETTGVFQFESSGMKRYLKELKPTVFEDVIAMVALYRPGPMEWIPDYISGKHGRKKVKYLHEKLAPILEKTYGVAIYQEQVMQIARDLAGFTMGEADVLRKAMGKKIAELLAKQKEKFIDGCVQNGIHKELAEEVFSFIEPFAGYGFNRSHAACYALIGYQTAYLKAHWPTEFMAALLTADQQNTDRIAIEIEECRNMGLEVMPPDINESFGSFTVVTSGTDKSEAVSQDEKTKQIRFGLKAIKNVGEHITEVVIEERKNNGPYKDIFDLLERVTDKDLNKKSLESLIKAGAFDNFEERGKLLGNVESLLNFNKEISRSKSNGQNSLFADMPLTSDSGKIKLADLPPADKNKKLEWEKELLGLYITEHPFNEYKKYLKDAVVPFVNLRDFLREDFVNVAGVVSSIKKIITRRNENMFFVKIEDAVSSTEILVFPKLLKETLPVWVEGKIVICQGKVSDKDQEIKILANRAMALNLEDIEKSIFDFKKTAPTKSFKNFNNTPTGDRFRPIPSRKENPLKIFINRNFSEEEMEKLKKILINNPGQDKTYFKIIQNNQTNIIETAFKVENSHDLVQKIKEDCGGFVEIIDSH